jgi:uncharacterized protein (TIGR02453 family)
MRSPFTRKTLSFLRALKRHNNRDWFRERKAQYDEHVRGPMIDLLARLAADLPSFAPELISDPRVSLYRIYRDTRFSSDKRPLKTHVAAHFPARGFPRNQGAGLYLEITPAWVWIGGGLYMPEGTDLRAIREQIAVHHRRLHRIVTAAAFRRAVGSLEGEQLSRVPLGYPKDHAAADYLRFKQFLAGREFDAELAIRDRFYAQVLTIFRAVAPLVRFLNAPLLAARATLPFDPADSSTLLAATSAGSRRTRTATSRARLPVMPMPPTLDGALMPGPRQTGRRPALPVATS